MPRRCHPAVLLAPVLAATALAASAAATVPVPAATPSPSPARNLQATRAYYQQVVSTPSRASELELLMAMLPKGGDLHHHYSGAIYAETYLDWAGRLGYCVHRASLRIDTAQPPAPSPAGDECLTAQQVRDDEPTWRGLLMRWSDKDFANHPHDTPPPDQQFFDTFGYFGAASGWSPHDGLLQLKRRAQDENVQYLETMMNGAARAPVPAGAGAALDALPPDAPDAAVDATLAPLYARLLADTALQQGVRDYRQALSEAAQGVDDATFTLRFIAYVNRGNAPSQVFANLVAAFLAAQDNPLVVGVNIVAPENGVVAMRDYALHMRMFHFLKARHPATHLSLHAGELALGMVPPEGLRDHIAQAVRVAGAERIGHGVDIAQERGAPGLLAEMRGRGVAVEVNLASNEFILGVAGDAHPVQLYRRQGVPVVISTDDAGVSRSTLGHEYLLFASRYRPAYDDLKRIVADSLRHAFLPPAARDAQLRELARRFARFEAEVAALAASGRRAP